MTLSLNLVSSYGFCEYKDTETALSAMRNLNGFEIGGRTLRVDNACTEKSRMEMQTIMNTQAAAAAQVGNCDKDRNFGTNSYLPFRY